MIEGKKKISVTLDHDLATFADRLVESGYAASVSAVVTAAMESLHARDVAARAAWQAKLDEADENPAIAARVERMKAHIARQLRDKGLAAPGGAA
ncbi:ribbon-helix-helix domain-containing protein [Herbidospora mongoliensis]|uniref:ribbon-helix-helix domain-containing protein n=1 Tax=Herbidospora mongoliensis TaxID=688067 RepID=UPI00082E380D|nr:hypothetical protein [Herbidospora mongoliensis]